ncbi:MAG: EamA family transporter, partial [Chloroflexota bacterium]
VMSGRSLVPRDDRAPGGWIQTPAIRTLASRLSPLASRLSPLASRLWVYTPLMNLAIGVLCEVLSTASFGLNSVTIRRATLKGNATQGMYVSVFIGVPVFFVACWISGQLGQLEQLSGQSIGLLAAAGVLHFLFGRYCNYRCVAALGAMRSHPIRSAYVLYSSIVAILVLHEPLTLAIGIGTALVVIGSILIVETPTQQRASAHSSGPAVRWKEGIIFALLAALVYGTSPIIVRAALSSTGLGVLGGTISYLAAGLVLLAGILLIPSHRSGLQAMDRETATWFSIAGGTVTSAQLFRYMALAILPVTIQVPLEQMTGIFTIIFSWMFNRTTESFSARVILGILLSMSGSIALFLPI